MSTFTRNAASIWHDVLLGMWASHLAFTYVHVLSSPATDLLSWSEEDMKVHPQAAVLGASLEAGKDLYPELQWTYMPN